MEVFGCTDIGNMTSGGLTLHSFLDQKNEASRGSPGELASLPPLFEVPRVRLLPCPVGCRFLRLRQHHWYPRVRSGIKSFVYHEVLSRAICSKLASQSMHSSLSSDTLYSLFMHPE